MTSLVIELDGSASLIAELRADPRFSDQLKAPSYITAEAAPTTANRDVSHERSP
ncbi:hypothetical protein [Dyella sp.]|uniref:hypothetical protein n=1 Tax=Dyella sp. TaxID=1869338 RepID=UPI00284DD154|nr:hypothetical protein [Dyella sp.]MDR3446666.1 hypothetical protein [Dyella sp.]